MTPAPSIVRGAPNRRRRSNRLLLASLAALAALFVVACSSTPSAPVPTDQAAATEGPVGTGPTPKPTAWPGDVVSAMIALGAADASFQSMGNDLQTAVDSGNLQELLQVTNDSLTFLKGVSQNVPHLQGYDSTKALGDALAAAFGQMTEGMQKIHDSLQNGDASGVTAGFQEFVAGNTAYGAQRQTLSDMSQEAIFMQRIYLR